MKIKQYPYKVVRKFGQPRKKGNEIRVSSYDKDKPTIIFIGSNKWALTKNKKYRVIKTDLISNSDDLVYDKEIKSHSKHITNHSHQMNGYFKIINDLGNKRLYPQTLFKLMDEEVKNVSN